MDTVAGMDPEAFVRAHTAVAASPFLPRIRLHMAADAFALWERTEEELGGGVWRRNPARASLDFPGRGWRGTGRRGGGRGSR